MKYFEQIRYDLVYVVYNKRLGKKGEKKKNTRAIIIKHYTVITDHVGERLYYLHQHKIIWFHYQRAIIPQY